MNRKPEIKNQKSLNRLKILAAFLTVGGVALFAYFIHSVGFGNILAGIGRLGFDGFALIIFLYFLRMLTRAAAWKLSVGKPYNLGLRDAVSAVIIGEALSSLIPLGILISGTSKAIAVRNRVPLVVGLSSVATENLFYSLMTGVFIVVGGVAFLRNFQLEQSWMLAIDVLIGLTTALIIFGILMIVRQWHLASAACEKLYRQGIAVNLLENGRAEVRRFEDFIYGFYREYPNRFAPILFFQFVFHLIGIVEIWFILSRLSDSNELFYTAFMLESISRIILIVFKLVPFVIGVDEAGAQFVTETLGLGAGIGVTIGIIRKARIIFWTAIGLIIIFKRGISLKEITNFRSKSELSGTVEKSV